MKRIKTILMIILIVFLGLAGCTTKETTSPSPALAPPPNDEDHTNQTEPNIELPQEIDLTAYGVNLFGNDYRQSADGKWGAFTGAKYDEEHNITKLFLLDISTGELKIIAEGSWIKVLDVHPTGEGISYWSYVNDREVLNIYYQGENIEIIDGSYGSFSPDGSQIAYGKHEQGLFIYDLSTKSETLLVEEKEPWYPIWFPNNRTLFYFADMGKTLTDGAGQLQGFATIDTKTKEKIQITDQTGKFRSARWIIPGKLVHIFAGWDDGAYNMIVDLTSEQIMDLGEDLFAFGGTSYAINLSKELFYLTTPEQVQLYQDLESVGAIQIIDEWKPYLHITASPDGEKIAFLAGDMEFSENFQGRSIWIANHLGGNPEKITAEKLAYTTPQWINENTLLSVVNDRDKEIFKIVYIQID